LDSLSLAIWPGEHVVVLGPNGCGKSTLLRLLTREIHPYAGIGAIRVMGQKQWTQRQLRDIIGVVGVEPTEPFLGEPTVRDLVLSGLFGTYGVLLYDEVEPAMVVRADEIMTTLQIDQLAERSVETLSLGERRRAWIGRALIGQPKALVLDEPTTGLDITARIQLLETLDDLRAQGLTTVLVTHHFEEIPRDPVRVALMTKGRFIADGPASEVLTPERLEQAFGTCLEAAPQAGGGWTVWATKKCPPRVTMAG
ncbi:MAG: ABC transporter ATP-binding protein, partial [Fimbriimonas sp.]